MRKLTTLLLAVAALALLGAGSAQAKEFVFVNSSLDGISNAEQNSYGRQSSTKYRWTQDKVYILTRIIYVKNNITLEIEPGTLIRGLKADTADAIGEVNSLIEFEPGTLVVPKGSKLVANGTPELPIIFTSIDDTNVIGGTATIPPTVTIPTRSVINLSGTTVITGTTFIYNGDGDLDGTTDYGPDLRDYAMNGPTDNNAFNKFKVWGGVILCGEGFVSQNTAISGSAVDANADGIWDLIFTNIANPVIQNSGTGRDFIEGFDPTEVQDSILAIYGGLDDDHNNGVVRFTQIRYSGFDIGGFDGNEINSLTMGGLGTQTVIDFIESSFNFDDGFEWFGGKNDSKFLFNSYCHDDGLDGDEGFRGNIQFATVIQPVITITGSVPFNVGQGVRVGFGLSGTSANIQWLQSLNSAEGTNLGDKLVEWDGAEPNDSNGLPRTNVAFYNTTSLAGGNKRGFRFRRDAIGGLYNVVAQNNTPFFMNDNTTGAGFVTQVTVERGFWYTTGTGTTGSLTSVTGTPTLLAAPIINVTQGEHYKENGVDFRLLTSATAARAETGSVVIPAGLVPVQYAGFQRDNNFLNDWSHQDALNLTPVTNLARPTPTLGVSGSFATVSFTAASADTIYVIETSDDERSFTYEARVSGTAGPVTVTTTKVVDGTPLYVRVYGL
jgi:hypothetical protein